jgi:hypothetical protein
MAITGQTRKIIWARSGNRCSICKTELVLQKDQFNIHLNIGEECHIISRQPQGPRHQNIEGFDYDDSSNILLLCCNHHKTVDERIQEYTVDVLINIKKDHEAWITNNLDPNPPIAEEVNQQDSIFQDLINFVTSKHDIEMNITSSRQVFESEQGLQKAFDEAEKIRKRIYEITETIKRSATGYNIILKDNKTQICDIRFKGHTFLAQFNQAYTNSANGSYLLFAVVKGHYNDDGYADPFYPCTVLEIIRLDFTFNEKGEFGWREQENNKAFYNGLDITDLWTRKFFKEALK